MAIYDNPGVAAFGSQPSKKRKAGDSPEPIHVWPGAKKRKKQGKSIRTSPGLKRKYKKSELAKIFGTAPVLNNGESGWTPLDLQHRPSWRKFRTEEAKRNEQRRRLFGFDSNQLQSIDALPALINEEAPLLKLDNPIHPIFALRHWRSRETMPANRAFWRIGNGRPGYWEAQNPLVWEILEPILKLASQFLINSHISHWWDTLLHGERRVFTSTYLDGLRTIHRRPVETFYANRAQVRRKLVDTSGLISFAIDSGLVNTFTGLGPSQDDPQNIDEYYHAFTVKRDILGLDPVEVTLAQHLFKPFLRQNMTQAEKLGLQFLIASTLVHEIAHAIGDLYRRENSDFEGGFPWEELFFEDEALAEYGYSLTMALFCAPVAPARWRRYEPFVRVYGETGQALYLGQLASGSQFYSLGNENGRWKWLPPPPHAPALPLNKDSQDSIIAHTIQTRRIQDQNLAITALRATRGALSDWRAKFLSKKEKHEWYETQREREEMGVEGLPPEPDSPLSALTLYSSYDPDPDDQSGNESDFSHKSSPSNKAPERYEYIHSSLCSLRLILALDSMHNHVPINLLLEYLNREMIRLRRSVVGPEEFEEYLLHIALEKKICFNLFIHPIGAIDITILPTGWPSDQELLPHPRAPLPPLYRDPTQLATDIIDFRTCSLHHETWRMREAPPLAPRFMFIDIDSEDIRINFNNMREENLGVDADVFAHIVAACPDLWTVGPPGVLRFIGPEPWEGARTGKLWEPPEAADTEMTDVDVVMEM
ncbi:hypothetical protein V490_06381 [Pseudogymnoascus sp. VKM F-3557]|nr:hypothetical protein V490_06381 [Pseudogymnoascus sp. VKM F-3557]